MGFKEADYKKEKETLEAYTKTDSEAAKAVEGFDTQSQLAELMGASQQSVSRFEKGHGGNLSFIVRYAQTLGYTLELKEI